MDCAPLVIAKELGFADEEGLDLTLAPQPSWSALRDMLALGHLDAAQMLAPLPIAMSMGMGGLPAAIDALMVLSVNGTVFGVSRTIADRMRANGASLDLTDPLETSEALLTICDKTLRVGVPFPYSMHRLLFDYWLSASALNRGIDIEVITVPPPRMSAAIRDGMIDMFCVGEPWGTVSVTNNTAELIMPGARIWKFAPEKVLAARRVWIEENPELVRALMRAVFHAAKWLDNPRNKTLATEILARSAHLNLPLEAIDPAITGRIIPSPHAEPTRVPNFLIFNRQAANFPWRSQAAWISDNLGATQTQRETGIGCFRADLYRQNLSSLGVDMPGASAKVEGAMRHATAVASTRGHMILGPDAFFDGKTYE